MFKMLELGSLLPNTIRQRNSISVLVLLFNTAVCNSSPPWMSELSCSWICKFKWVHRGTCFYKMASFFNLYTKCHFCFYEWKRRSNYV